MKLAHPEHAPPADAEARRAIAPVICYPVETLPRPDVTAYRAVRPGWDLLEEVIIPAREARFFEVQAGHFSASSRSRGRRWAT